MKKIITYGLFIILSFTFIINFAKADSCTYKEQSTLAKEAANINVTYELPYKELDDGYTDTIDGVISPEGENVTGKYEGFQGYYFRMFITNLTENFKITFSEPLAILGGNVVKEITANDANENGMIELYTLNLTKRRTLNISIVSNTVNCQNKKLRTKRATIPKYNAYSSSNLCEGHKDLKICGDFYDTDDDEQEFIKRLNKALNPDKKEEDKKSFWTNISSLLGKYWWVMLIAVVLIGIGIVAYIIYRKRRKI